MPVCRASSGALRNTSAALIEKCLAIPVIAKNVAGCAISAGDRGEFVEFLLELESWGKFSSQNLTHIESFFERLRSG